MSNIIIEKLMLKLSRIFHKAEAFYPGHYFSAIPDKNAWKNKRNSNSLTGLQLNIKDQLDFLELMRNEHLVTPLNSDNLGRFRMENPTFSYDDAPVLHYFLRMAKPKRVIEIGSGNSSALMLDTNDQYLDSSIEEFTFIDIDLTNLKSKLNKSDLGKVRLIEEPIQSVNPDIFEDLSESDLLFIDSSHVLKLGSDLNFIFFEIIPRLKPGVFIHFHDIRYPFEYGNELTKRGVFWNEAYILHAFLMYNNQFTITFWLNSLLNQVDVPKSKFDFLPLELWNDYFYGGKGDVTYAGGSMYIQKK